MIETLLAKLFPPNVGKVETWESTGSSFDPFDLPESIDGIGEVREKAYQQAEKPRIRSITGHELL